jgi:folate-binding protein YgfZ
MKGLNVQWSTGATLPRTSSLDLGACGYNFNGAYSGYSQRPMQLKMTQLSHLCALEFHGPDAAAFLHNQTTAEIKGLAVYESTFASLCNPAGRVLATLLLQRVEEGFLALCAQSLSGLVVTELSRYIFRMKVTVSARTDWAVVGLTEMTAAEDLMRILTPHLDYGIMPHSEGLEALDTTSVSSWRAEELQHGINWLDEDTSGEYLPQMLGLDMLGAVSFTKGCYPGQEIIIRIRHLGKLKRHPYICRLSCANSLDAGDKVSLYSKAGSAPAEIVNVQQDSVGRCWLFLVVRCSEERKFDSLESSGQSFELQVCRRFDSGPEG